MKRLIAAGCLLLGFAGAPLNAAENESESRSDPMKSCREEVWRVYLPASGGPKSTWLPRTQKRTVFVCDKQVFTQSQKHSPTILEKGRSGDGLTE